MSPVCLTLVAFDFSRDGLASTWGFSVRGTEDLMVLALVLTKDHNVLILFGTPFALLWIFFGSVTRLSMISMIYLKPISCDSRFKNNRVVFFNNPFYHTVLIMDLTKDPVVLTGG